jgi:hypothetical protein
MLEHISHPPSWRACAASFAFMLLTIDAGHSVEQSVSGNALCAERETLLQTIVEAHGQAPNAATAKLTETSSLMLQARTACDEGRVEEAVALYDRIIAEIGLTLPNISRRNCPARC